MGKRIAVIMAYINRKAQLIQTLHTMRQSEHKNYRVFIADDGAEPLTLPDYPEAVILPVTDKTWVNQLPGYNMALKYALDTYKPDIFIIQNPECYHVGDVLAHTSRTVTENNYVTFATYSLDKNHTLNNSRDIRDIIADNDRIVTTDGGIGWYNHPTHRPVYYEFCAAISRNNMIMLNGYDERMAYGIAYDDDYMVWRVKLMGLELKIVTYPFVVHQWHEQANEHPEKSKLVHKNHALFNTLKMQGQFRAEHIITPDL